MYSIRKTDSVPLPAFLRLQKESAQVGMTKLLHYPISYDTRYNYRRASRNYEPANVNTSSLPKEGFIGTVSIGVDRIRTSKTHKNERERIEIFTNPASNVLTRLFHHITSRQF
jgi:hypothetical protein